VRYEVLMALTMNIDVFWNVRREVWYMFTTVLEKSVAYVFRVKDPSSVLKMKAGCSSEISLNRYQMTPRY
jgi:hypothetical protein